MKKNELRKLIKEELLSEAKYVPIDNEWSFEIDGGKVFLLYKDKTAATIYPESMDNICRTWKKIKKNIWR